MTIMESLAVAGVSGAVSWGAWVTLSLGKVRADVAYIRGLLTAKNGNGNGNGKKKR